MTDAAIDKAFALGTIPGSASGETGQKLAMEVSLLTGGVAQGAWARTKEYAAHPVESTLTVGATTAATWAAGYAAMRFLPSIVPAAKYVLAAAAIVEAAPGLTDAAHAAIQTWSDPTSYKQNKELVADKLGRPLGDLALYSIAGAGGFWKGRGDGKLATELAGSLELQATRRSASTHIPLLIDGEEASIKQIRLGKNAVLADVYAKGAPSIVQLVQRPLDGGTTFGTGFVVEDGLIATSSHVLRGRIPIMVKVTSGEMVEAKLVARDKAADLALLQLPAGALTARPVELGSTAALERNSQLYMIGHPRNVSKPVASSGILNGTYGQKYLHSSAGVIDLNPSAESFAERVTIGGQPVVRDVFRPEQPARVIRREVLSHTLATQPGNSGSPLFDAAGRVVGIQATGGEFKWGTSVEHLKALIEAYKAEGSPGTWLKVISNARPKAMTADSFFGRRVEQITTASVDVLDIKKISPRPAALAPVE